MKTKLNREIGERVRRARLSATLTQEALAEKIGIARASVVNIEGGSQTLTIPNLYKICLELSIPIDRILPNLEGIVNGDDKIISSLVEHGISRHNAKKFILEQSIGKSE